MIRQPEITEAGVERMVRAFYGRALVDPVLGPVFHTAIDDFEPHLATITDFWCAVMLGARRYQGNALAPHRKHPLEPAMFDRWLALWGETADDLFAPSAADALKGRAQRIAESLKLGLFFKPIL